MLASRFDRVNRIRALWAFELGKLGGERVALAGGEAVDSRFVHAGQHRAASGAPAVRDADALRKASCASENHELADDEYLDQCVGG
jgi:hypothetical protein